MFVGGRRRSSKNVRAMQLFHELKQQFPTIPDHVVAECIATTSGAEAKVALLAATAAAAAPTTNTTSANCHRQDQHQKPMAAAAPHRARNEETMSRNEKPKPAKRPDSLSLRQSDKCKDVHKLLAATSSSSSSTSAPLATMTTVTTSGLQKPPRPKTRNHLKPSEKTESGGGGGGGVVRKRTAEAQTTDTLLNATPTTPPPSVNLSLNVNVIRGGGGGVQPAATTSPTSKHSSVLNVVPQQPWCCSDLNSPRSYTSVNLTLRTPTSEPQPPIDITSQNSSLTYSTSSFDCQKGLQSRLQITVGPGGGTVSSVRTRPRSYHSPTSSPIAAVSPAVVGHPHHHGSLQDLTTTATTACCTTPTILKQQARIERLRIELISEKNRLVKIKAEVAQMKMEQQEAEDAISLRHETELQLQKEIRHLRTQCDLLTNEVDRQSENREITAPLGETSAEYYRNIYTGHHGASGLTAALRSPASGLARSHMSTTSTSTTSESKWSCPMCTFQNHPLLDKCEQCEMARILHGKLPKPATTTIGGNGGGVGGSNANTDFDKIQQLLAPCNNNNNNNNINSGVDLMRWLSEPAAPNRTIGDNKPPPSVAAVAHNSTSSTS